MRKLATLVTLGLIVGLGTTGCGYFENLEKERVKQTKDFEADLEAQGFSSIKTTRDTETSKNSSEMAFEASSKLRGCTVEMERKEDEDQVATTTDGRKIELYELDEVRGKDGKELDIAELTTIAPNADTVRKHLRQHKAACLTA